MSKILNAMVGLTNLFGFGLAIVLTAYGLNLDFWHAFAALWGITLFSRLWNDLPRE